MKTHGIPENEKLINRVAQSGLITIDLEKFFPTEELIEFDLKNFLFKELILKEKEFRESLLSIQWENYTNKHIAIFCSTDAIIPMWAYMLVSSYLSAYAASVCFGNLDTLKSRLIVRNFNNDNLDQYKDKRIIIKGCGDKKVPPAAYVEVTNILTPLVKSLMYGEACSTVPVFKQKP